MKHYIFLAAGKAKDVFKQLKEAAEREKREVK